MFDVLLGVAEMSNVEGNLPLQVRNSRLAQSVCASGEESDIDPRIFLLSLESLACLPGCSLSFLRSVSIETIYP